MPLPLAIAATTAIKTDASVVRGLPVRCPKCSVNRKEEKRMGYVHKIKNVVTRNHDLVSDASSYVLLRKSVHFAFQRAKKSSF
jgi:hypothetical protein